MAASQRSGFSLVEVVISIGIFAFVIVGIVGLFPAALRVRADAALDTRAAMIAQQMIASVDASTNFSNIIIPVGAYAGNPPTATNNLFSTSTVVGYAQGGALPYWHFYNSPGSCWSNAAGDNKDVADSVSNNIALLARLSISTNGLTNMARVMVEVRSSPLQKLTNARVVTFTTLRHMKPLK